jgi:histone-lysine N-methyltransferase SETMAR
MLKPNSSQSSACKHIHQTSRKRLNKRCLPESWWQLFSVGRKGVLMVEFMQRGMTITSEMYCETLKRLHSDIQNKMLGMLTYGVVILPDNARAHTAVRTRALLEHFNWEVSDRPSYSPDLAPSAYHLSTYLKNWLRSQRFNNNEGLMEGVKTSASIPTVTTLRNSLSM